MSKRAPSKGGRGSDAALAVLFDRLFPGPSWLAWKACVSAIFGLPVSDEQAALIRRCTARATTPKTLARNIWIICGRQAGKSQIAALIAVYLACFKTYKRARGERLIGMLLAQDRKQAGILKDFISGLLHDVPELEALIVKGKELQESIELTNGITIEIHTSSFRSVRGYRCIFVICDEIAFWPSDGPDTDVETLNALRPTLLTTGGPLICLSSPYSRTGALYLAFQRHFGQESDDAFVWMSDTVTMNPSVSSAVIEDHYRDDAERAASEYGRDGQIGFRSDLQSLFMREALEACVVPGRRELPPQPGVFYNAHADTSGGSDESFGAAITHKDHQGRVVVDVVREWPAPFDPSIVVRECGALLKRYACKSIVGDFYGAQWVVTSFAQHGITYERCEKNKSELFLEVLATVNARQVELPDHSRLLAQFAGLQRRVGRQHDSIDHRPGQRDDLANAVAGAIFMCLQSSGLAALPATFVTCYRALSIAGFDPLTCYLAGGPFRPPADICCNGCPGHQFVLAARRAHLEKTGEGTDLAAFYRERINWQANPWIAHLRANRWADNSGL